MWVFSLTSARRNLSMLATVITCNQKQYTLYAHSITFSYQHRLKVPLSLNNLGTATCTCRRQQPTCKRVRMPHCVFMCGAMILHTHVGLVWPISNRLYCWPGQVASLAQPCSNSMWALRKSQHTTSTKDYKVSGPTKPRIYIYIRKFWNGPSMTLVEVRNRCIDLERV